MEQIIVYTVDCPKCIQLEKRLTQRGINYEVCKDIEVMKSLGIKTAPYLQVGDELMDFTKAWKWANSQEVNK